MYGEAKTECGLMGAMDRNGGNVIPLVFQGTAAQQHRGELGWGIGRYKEDCPIQTIKIRRRLGKIIEADANEILSLLSGRSGIGHVRYATDGPLDAALCHPQWFPMHRDHIRPFLHGPKKTMGSGNRSGFALAFNGNIINTDAIRTALKRIGIRPRIEGDTELIGQLVAELLRNNRVSLADALKGLSVLDGAYCIVILLPDGSIVAVRDKHAIKPLVYSQEDGLRMVASETIGLRSARNGKHIHTESVPGGSMIHMNPWLDNTIEAQQLWPEEPRHCFFEDIYFKDERSKSEETSVANTHYEGGEVLAENDQESDRIPKDAIVVPVLESAKTAGTGYSRTSGLQIVEGITVREKGRTFTEGKLKKRKDKAKKKYGIDRKLLRGRTIVLVDDSIVRGNTMESLIQRLYEEGGVKEIHLRLACPPIMHPCFYGIDFSTIEELIVRKVWDGTLDENGRLLQFVLDKLAKMLNIASIEFLPSTALSRVMNLPDEKICKACVTNKYPTPCGQARSNLIELFARKPHNTQADQITGA